MKWIMMAVAVVFVASMFYGISASRFSGSSTGRETGIAKINGKKIDPIRYQDMFNRLLQQFGQNASPSDMAFVENLALQQTIDFQLVLDQANKKVRISNREVDMVISNMMQQQGIKSKKDLETALKRMGLSYSKFKQIIKEEMLVQKMMQKVREDVKVTPEDLREVRASHILVTTEAEAKEVLSQVKSGADFAKLAKQYSLDPGSKNNGGDLGFFSTGMMVEPFEQAAFKLKVNEVSGIVKSPFGYHIIKVTDSKLRQVKGNEKDIEKSVLAEKQNAAFQRWFSNLKTNAKVEVISPELKANQLRFQGKTAQAIEEYKKAIVQDPNNPYLRLFLADTYASLGQDELALLEYEEALKMQASNFNLYLAVATAYEKGGKKKEAILTLERGSLIAGDNKAQHEQLLKEFERLGAKKQARLEKSEISRIEKKEKFEKELTGE